MKKEIKKKELNIVEKYTEEVEKVINDETGETIKSKQFQLINCLLELEARQKNCYLLLEEIKEVLAGMAQWSSEVETRLQKLDPKIEIISEHEGKQILKGI